jgi:hypothetical protein
VFGGVDDPARSADDEHAPSRVTAAINAHTGPARRAIRGEAGRGPTG